VNMAVQSSNRDRRLSYLRFILSSAFFGGDLYYGERHKTTV
jgi:hypothetical protein